MENPLQQLSLALFQVAWADEAVSPQEVQGLMTVFRQLGWSLPEVICLLDRNLSQRPSSEPVELEKIFADRESRLEAMQALLTVCFADGVLQPQQLGYIEGLIYRMGITVEELKLLKERVENS